MKTRGKSGQALLLTVMSATVLMAMMAAGISIGTVYVAKNRLQQAVNTAALAGAQALQAGDSSAPQDQAYIVAQNDPAASGITLTYNSTTQVVTANAGAAVPGGFASLFGIAKFPIQASAQAIDGPGTVFNYAIFQGATNQPLDIPNNMSINGNVRSNQAVDLGATGDGGGSVSGVVQAATEVEKPDSWTVSCRAERDALNDPTYPCVQNNQPVIGMPNWPVASLPQTGTLYNGNQDFTSNHTGNIIVDNGDVTVGPSLSWEGNIIVNGGNVSVAGNASFQGSITVIGGSVTIGSSLSFGGNILVTGGNITVDGNLSVGKDGIALGAFSQDINGTMTGGNITIGSSFSLDGTAYAPDGTITITGNNSVQGAVVGKYVQVGPSASIDWNKPLAIPSAFQQPQLLLPGTTP